MNYSLRQVQAFLAVCELGSFTRAARQLNLSQSAVSGLIGELEQGLGVRLLDRTTRRVEPNEAGLSLAARASMAVSDLHQAVLKACDVSAQLRERLSVSAPPLLAAALLPSVMAAHRARHPGVAITLVDGTTEETLAATRAGRIDLGIGTLPSGIQDLGLRVLAADRLLLFCPRSHPLASARQVPWHALDGHDVVALSPASGLRQLMEATLRSAGVRLRPAFEVAQITTALALVEAGMGVAVLPSIARVLRGYGRLTTRLLVQPAVRRPIHVVYQSGRVLPATAESFVKLLREELGRMTALQALDIALNAE